MKVSKDDDWFRGHYDELREKYTGEFIAIEAQSVVDHSNNMKILVGNLKKKNKTPSNLLIKFVRERGKIVVLNRKSYY